jgi:CubicO group peptidase (beta-lactamase class C family)
MAYPFHVTSANFPRQFIRDRYANQCMLRRSAFILILLFLACLRGWTDPAETNLEDELAKRLPADGPGVTVLVARDGKLLFSHGYGWANRENQIPATPGTRFRIGSVTKQFTAAAILKLAEEGKLSIDNPLAAYFPDYPNGKKITLRELLNQTSGLHNYTAHPDFMARVVHPIAPADLISWFRDDPPDFPPGEQWEYSNTNYLLLGQIVEKVSGQSLSNFLKTRFFDPLGLHDTGVWVNANPPTQAAKGYAYSQNHLVPALDWDMSWAGGAGALYSTTGDLWHWTEALQEGHVLSPASLRTMLTEGVADKPETLTRYAMGLTHSEIAWLPNIGHTGGLQGFLSAVEWFPGQKTTVVVLQNAFPGPPSVAPLTIVPMAVHTFLAPEISASAPRIDPTVSAETYPDFAGRYDYMSAFQDITVEKGHLYAQLTGQNRFEVYPSAPDQFFFKVAEARLRFNLDKEGRVISVTHTQNGATFTALKLATPVPAPISIAALDRITGHYRYGYFAVLTVSRHGDQLYAQLTGQPEAPIFPKSDHEFFWKIAPASVEFVPGPTGKIDHAIHHQNGLTFNAPKID